MQGTDGARVPRRERPEPTGVERTFGDEELIVSKTDLTGRITYANAVFQRISGYSEAELVGAPHSILRHPDMPRAVFKLLWDTIESRREIFAYVVNLAKSGDHYWVYAHVTPTFDARGAIIGYHSNRRRPDPTAVAAVRGLYAELLAVESRHDDRAAGLAAGVAHLEAALARAGATYEELVWSLAPREAA